MTIAGKILCAAAGTILFASAGIAQQSQTPTPRPAPGAGIQFPNLACAGPFARDTSHARIMQAFGKQNVVFADVPGPEGSTEKATVIFPKDAKRRLEVTWSNQKARTQPLSIAIKENSGWIAPHGVRIGSTLEEVEKANGRPFPLSGFYWDLGGQAGFAEGALWKNAGGCVINVRFEPSVELPEAQQSEISGDRQIQSNDPVLRAAKPRVTDVYVGYAYPQ